MESRQAPDWERAWKRQAKSGMKVGVVGLAARMMGVGIMRGVTARGAANQHDLLQVPKRLGIIYYQAIVDQLTRRHLTVTEFNELPFSKQAPIFVTIDNHARLEISKTYFAEYQNILGTHGNEAFFEELNVTFRKHARSLGGDHLGYFTVLVNTENYLMKEPYVSRAEIRKIYGA